MMNQRFRNIVALVVFTISVVICCTFLAKFFLGGTLNIDVRSYESVHKISVFVNNELVLSKNETSKTIKMPNQFGSKNIIVRAAGYEDYSITTSVYFRGEKTITPAPKKELARDVAARLDTGVEIPGGNIIDAQYFGDVWLAYRIKTEDMSQEGSVFIAYFDIKEGKWKVINYGGENEIEPTLKYPIPEALLEEYL